MIGCIDSAMEPGCSVSSKPTMVDQLARTSSGVMDRPDRTTLPRARSQRSLPKKPPPTSKSPPLSSQSSWHSQATSGET